MMRKIQSMTEEFKDKALDMVEAVFTDYENADEAKVVRNLVEEIRRKRFYVPELELIMVDETNEVIGFVKAKELEENALERIKGSVNYDDYESLK